MKTKLIITEEQALKLKNSLKENKSDYDIFLPKIIEDLNKNYEPEIGVYRQGGEYFEKPMIKVKTDNEQITPKDLLFYLKNKHKHLSEEFLKQLILDWINGDIKDNRLSKNVALNESKDYLKLLTKLYIRKGEKNKALEHLINKGYNEEEANKYIENTKKSI